MLHAVDQAFAERKSRPAPPRRPLVTAPPLVQREVEGTSTGSWWSEAGWLEVFVGLQVLWGVLMFIPGAQAFRGYIRALPYISSLALFGVHFMRHQRGALPASAGLLIGALALLVVNLLHPTSQLAAGLAQCVFQLSIVGPAFWALKSPQTPARLERLLLFLLVLNSCSAGLGILQVYYPDRFMPPEFNLLGQEMYEHYMDSLSYIGASGQTIVRPPGLTDQPGGAALAGGLSAVLGIALLLRTRKPLRVALLIAVLVASLAVIYLTQVRSVLLAAVGAGALVCLLAARTGRVANAAGGLITLGALIVGSFLWASSIGGNVVENRFLQLRSGSLVQAYQENRGDFLSQTTGELLTQYPLGAGIGRWGMMNAYFGDALDVRSSSIYVEIQLTGWLLDGGVPMWFFYGGAVIVALLSALRLTAARLPKIADSATMVVGVLAFIATMAMVGPVFNTQLGILFWTMSAALRAAVVTEETEVVA